MLKQRAMEIARYLNRERMASYKELAGALGEKERIIRYDIDQINDELKQKGSPQIEKYPKGMLYVPDGLNIPAVLEDSEFVLAPRERVAVIRLYALFGAELFNIRVLCEELQVSRRTIQNDIAVVQNELAKYGMKFSYDRGFRLEEAEETGFDIRSGELKRYASLLNQTEGERGQFEAYMYRLIGTLMSPVSLDDLLGWLNAVIETLGWRLSDDTFCWYVSNVLTFTWYVNTGKALPDMPSEKNSEIANFIPQYEALTGKKLGGKEMGILSGFSKYTNRYVYFDVTPELMSVEDVTMEIVAGMGKELHMDFSADGILIKGLLNHMKALLKRVRDHRQLREDVTNLLPKKYEYVHAAMREVLKKQGELYALTENESIYLTLYFLGSFRRIQQSRYMSVLLICGYGYGTTTIIKDALITEYQVFVYKSIPAYQLSRFQEWDEIDAVVSTVNVDLPVERPFAQVNVIFREEDYAKLDLLGIQRRNVLTNYLAIERKLDFLSEGDRKRVLDVIREELGYKDVRIPQKYYMLTDLLSREDIMCVDRVEDWQEAVRLSAGILEKNGKTDVSYRDSIIRGIEAQGFYSVTDGMFALLHGSETAGVYTSCVSLVISREPVHFGEKQVNIIFCLASRDKKEHTPAVINLMRMVSRTKMIELLEACRDADKAWEALAACEQEVKEKTEKKIE